MDDAYPSSYSASRDAVVDPPPSSPGHSVSDGEAESRWPYLFRAGLNPDTLLDDGPQLLPEGPSVGLCDAARQSLGTPRSVLLVWLAHLYGAKWPEPEPQSHAVTFLLKKKVKASASSLRKSSGRAGGKERLQHLLSPAGGVDVLLVPRARVGRIRHSLRRRVRISTRRGRFYEHRPAMQFSFKKILPIPVWFLHSVLCQGWVGGPHTFLHQNGRRTL